MTVDSQGFVVNQTSVTTHEINNNAPASGQYRKGQDDVTIIASAFTVLNAFLLSTVYYQDDLPTIFASTKGVLGSYSIDEDRSLSNFHAWDPTDMVINMLNAISFRAGAISGFPNSKILDPNLPSDEDQM